MINKRAIETAVKHMRGLTCAGRQEAAAQLFTAMVKDNGHSKGYGWTRDWRSVLAAVRSNLALYRLKDWQPVHTNPDDALRRRLGASPYPRHSATSPHARRTS